MFMYQIFLYAGKEDLEAFVERPDEASIRLHGTYPYYKLSCYDLCVSSHDPLLSWFFD